MFDVVFFNNQQKQSKLESEYCVNCIVFIHEVEHFNFQQLESKIMKILTTKEIIQNIKTELKQLNAKIDKDYKNGIVNKILIEHKIYLMDQLRRYYELDI